MEKLVKITTALIGRERQLRVKRAEDGRITHVSNSTWVIDARYVKDLGPYATDQEIEARYQRRVVPLTTIPPLDKKIPGKDHDSYFTRTSCAFVSSRYRSNSMRVQCIAFRLWVPGTMNDTRWLHLDASLVRAFDVHSVYLHAGRYVTDGSEGLWRVMVSIRYCIEHTVTTAAAGKHPLAADSSTEIASRNLFTVPTKRRMRIEEG